MQRVSSEEAITGLYTLSPVSPAFCLSADAVKPSIFPSFTCSLFLPFPPLLWLSLYCIYFWFTVSYPVLFSLNFPCSNHQTCTLLLCERASVGVCHFQTDESFTAESHVQCYCVKGDRKAQRDTWAQCVWQCKYSSSNCLIRTWDQPQPETDYSWVCREQFTWAVKAFYAIYSLASINRHFSSKHERSTTLCLWHNFLKGTILTGEFLFFYFESIVLKAAWAGWG